MKSNSERTVQPPPPDRPCREFPGRPRLSAAGTIVSLIAFVLSGCGPSVPPPPVIRPAESLTLPLPAAPTASLRRFTPPVSDYVGSARCAECHEGIARSYTQTTMGRSAAVLSDAPVIEQFGQPSVPAAGGFQYFAEQLSTGMVHHERLLDRDGAVLYDQAVPIAYEFGSGQRGRSYLVQRDDQLHMSPLTWYSTAAKWDLSPGYAERNQHFERRVVEGCAQCHAGRLDWSDSGLPDRVETPAFLEAAIGCERCHGPGGRHIAWRREHPTPGPDESRQDPIVNPADLAPERRESICNQCHLLGVERVLRQGRRDRDFRPGDDLSAIWVIFSRSAAGLGRDTSMEAVNQVQQMRASRCFQASDGALGCTSCHDPHRQPSAAERTEFFRTRCLNCHTASTPCSLPLDERLSQSAEDSCIDCHMPRQQTNDVPHTAQTDHRVLRRPGQTSPTSPTSADPFTLFSGMLENVPERERERARGLLMSHFARELHDPALGSLAAAVLEPLAASANDDPECWRALGDACLVQNQPDKAEQAWRRALEIDPSDEASLRSLAVVFHDAGRDRQAIELFDRYLKSNRWDRVILGRQVHALGRIGRIDDARKLAEEAVERFPWDSRLQEWLAEACQAQGQRAEAELHRKIAERLKREP